MGRSNEADRVLVFRLTCAAVVPIQNVITLKAVWNKVNTLLKRVRL